MNDMLPLKSPYIVIQTAHAPYSTSAAIDALEAAFAATNIGITVVYIFVGDGVYQLFKQQQNLAIAHKSIYKKLCALPLFDVELIFAQACAVRNNKIALSDIDFDVSLLENDQLVAICAQAQQVLTF